MTIFSVPSQLIPPRSARKTKWHDTLLSHTNDVICHLFRNTNESLGSSQMYDENQDSFLVFFGRKNTPTPPVSSNDEVEVLPKLKRHQTHSFFAFREILTVTVFLIPSFACWTKETTATATPCNSTILPFYSIGFFGTFTP